MKIIIPQAVEAKIHAYVMSVDSEIAGMGKVKVIDASTILIEDVMIYEQEVTGTTADLSPQAMAKWTHQLVQAGGSPKDWRLWWHSHDTMPAFFSKRDTDTMDANEQGDWMLSLVVNKKRERKARLDTYRPFRVIVNDIEIEVTGEAFTIPADIALEVSQKVKRAAPVSYSYHGYGHDKGYTDFTPKSAYKTVKQAIEQSDDEPQYTIKETEGIIDTLESQMEAVVIQFGAESGAYKELAAELVDWYFALAELQTDENKAEEIRTDARAIEDSLYDWDAALTVQK